MKLNKLLASRLLNSIAASTPVSGVGLQRIIATAVTSFVIAFSAISPWRPTSSPEAEDGLSAGYLSDLQVGSFGNKDRNLRGAAHQLDHALEALGADHDIKEYPDASRAFFNDHRREGPWSVLYMMGLGHLPVIAGCVGAYREPSARDARQRILAFLERHLHLSGSAETA